MLRKPRNILPPKQNNIGISIGAAIVTCSLENLLYNHVVNLPNDVYLKNIDSIKSITATSFQKDPFSPKNMKEYPVSTGTGFYYKNVIVTNAHVIDGAFSIKINDRKVNILGLDKNKDVAILDPPKDFQKSLTSCSEISIGQQVIAIGDPYGLKQTMSSGIISGLNRTTETLHDLIQTDALIGPGSSGGPLLDFKTGCVLGMNTGIISSSNGNTGIGLAIPMSTIDSVLDEILNKEVKSHVQLGVSLLPDQYSDLLGIDGVIIADVLPFSLAEKIGLKGTFRNEYGIPYVGDIIVGINDKKIIKRDEFVNEMNTFKPGDKIDLHIIRENGPEIMIIIF